MDELTFTPLRLGPVQTANRLAMAPVKTALGGTDGCATSKHAAYYRRRAEGGAGLIIVEPLFVDSMGKEHPRQLGAHDDGVVEGLRDVVAAIHQGGAVAFAHLNHAGRAANPKASGAPPEAPSQVPCPSTGAMPGEMTRERIRKVIGAYGRAAERVVAAGFDGIELQLGLGYLPAQFLSRSTNMRSDEYGGDEQRRMRFVREVVEAVRGALGPSMAFTVRMSADEKCPGGLDLDDAISLARATEGWGVDGLHVVTGSACDNPAWYYQHMALPAGANERLASEIRRNVSIPVLVAGRLGNPERIREVLLRGMADGIALGRPLVADPDLPRKMALGCEQEIMSCGSCLQGCLGEVKRGGPIGCIVNPEVDPAAPSPSLAVGDHLVVIGGGPAGMEAAIIARNRGNHVTLLERRSELGGTFVLAPLTPGKEGMDRPLKAMIRAVEHAGVDVRCGVDATAEEILSMEPDRVVLATGSKPIVPEIPGLVHPITAEEVLTGHLEPGRRVLVLGGGLVGIEMAEMLAQRGHEVVVVELLADVARDMEPVSRKMAMKRLEELPVAIHTETRLVRMDGGEAVVVATDGDDEWCLGVFDSVLVAVGHRPVDELSDSLRAAGVEVRVIGDAERPAQILDATRAGLAAAVGSGIGE
ncbi:MAG: FAD-dependent oxidoreductase [Thermoanaerobaculales bacterium]|jgi:2,4-dienoyl-CoA reductase-like NADH-dependent reductase (Old Yellow Enzyme family)/thioredoxin reductase|nr:FAD-dependent oxidoreductase [Thermoanaerobaculales bacterium]